MRAPFSSLVRFYVASIYGLSIRGKPTRGEAAKADPKKFFKRIGIALLAILVVGDIGAVYAMMNISMYQALKPIGLQGLLILNAAMSASMVVFAMGFLTALSTYCMSQAETSLLALPIAPRVLLGAKLVMVYISEFALAFILMAVAAVIYGVMEGPGPAFYVQAFFAAIVTPLVPLALCYLILVPLMSAGRFLRDKNSVMIVGGVVGLALTLLFNIYIQTASARLGDSAWVLSSFAGPEALLARAGSIYPPAFLAWRAMTGSGLASLAAAAANLCLGLATVVLAVLALGSAYAKSLTGFDEHRLKRMRDSSVFAARTFRKGRLPLTLFMREMRSMNREPIYFLNGPFIVILLPVIFVVMYFAQRETFSGLLLQLGAFRAGPGAMLAGAAFGGFLGGSTSIACTALSRDAKALPYIKALPLSAADYMFAKFHHGLFFSLFGSAVGAIALGLFMRLEALEIVGSFIVAAAFSAALGIAGLWLDTANPRLIWDNPVTALKQNPNAVIAILGTMGLIAALALPALFLPLGKAGFVILYGGFFAAIAGAAIALYPRYAERRIAELEV